MDDGLMFDSPAESSEEMEVVAGSDLDEVADDDDFLALPASVEEVENGEEPLDLMTHPLERPDRLTSDEEQIETLEEEFFNSIDDLNSDSSSDKNK
jgi:hypothetical protein